MSAVTMIYEPIRREVTLNMPDSKSVVNRLMVMQFLQNRTISFNDDYASGDVSRMGSLLQKIISNDGGDAICELDCGPAGTVARFLAALTSTTNGRYLVTGNHRMQHRPMRQLVLALQQLGASIQFLEPDRDLPLLIRGGTLFGGAVCVVSDVSSQFVTALLLIAPAMKNGLELNLVGTVVSRPYIDMTINMMRQAGIEVIHLDSKITVLPGNYRCESIGTSGDWSAAAPWFQLVAFDRRLVVHLHRLHFDGLQGDERVVDLFANFGVATQRSEHGITISHTGQIGSLAPEIDFSGQPDLAQCYMATLAGLNLKQKLIGLQTLRLKETDRLAAMFKGLSAMGANLSLVDDGVVEVNPHQGLHPASIQLCDDHRMIFAFAPLAAVVQSVTVDQPAVSEKSYPDFLAHLKKVGYKFEQSF